MPVSILKYMVRFTACTYLFILGAACDRQSTNPYDESDSNPVKITRTGWLASSQLNEASGIQASHARRGDFFVHNDEGRTVLYTINESGKDLGFVTIVPAKNRDWEDITSIPVGDDRWIVIGDIGDNQAKRKSIKLYFIEEPKTGENDRYAGEQLLRHRLSLTYPDGPRDCESMAYDPIGKRILLISKRDKPAHLYTVDLETALSQGSAELEFLGTISVLRPTTIADRAQWGGRSDWISQPTGFDISPDGNEAILLTYRSVYRYQRADDEDWPRTLQRKPAEIIGPDAVQNEAITYAIDGKSVYVTTEKRPAPVFRIEIED